MPRQVRKYFIKDNITKCLDFSKVQVSPMEKCREEEITLVLDKDQKFNYKSRREMYQLFENQDSFQLEEI